MRRCAGWIAIGLASMLACQEATEPSHTQALVLDGDGYHRGFQHGRRISSHVRGLYTRLLTSALLPFLNREQVNIAPVLPVYQGPDFDDGQFSYQMLRESGRYLYDHHMDEEFRQELQGLADGAGMPLDEIIVLNTFVDTMMAFRAIVVFIEDIQTPYLRSVGWIGGPESDGVDNDGDGEADEEGEGTVADYDPSPEALMVEVDPDASFRFVVADRALGGLQCVDPNNIDPVDDPAMDAACVDPACVRDSCAGRATVDRNCLNERALDCLPPRVDNGCFDPMCVRPHDPNCVNPRSIRIRMNDRLFAADDPAVAIRRLPADPPGMGAPVADPDHPHFMDCQGPLEVTFAPPDGFPAGQAIAMTIQAGDLSPVYSPGPYHERFMRDERVVFTTTGYAAAAGTGHAPHEVPNAGVNDGRTQPPSIAFAARGGATPDSEPRLAHHFALLDSNILHEHAALFTVIPEHGIPHTYLGWTGVLWGFSGMNAEGLALAVNTSDTLDNPLAGHILSAIFDPENLVKLLRSPDLAGLAEVLAETRMISVGAPIGVMIRSMLSGDSTVAEAVERLHGSPMTYGWNFLLADAAGRIEAVETDSAVLAQEAPGVDSEDRDGFARFDPEATRPGNLDAHGRRWSSVGADDLFMASHFRKNVEDIRPNPIMGSFSPQRQRGWTGFYYRSLRAYYLLSDRIAQSYGALDAPGAIEILRVPELNDTRDSMNSAVYEPAAGLIWWAMGEVPATDGPFVRYDLHGELASWSAP